MDRQMDLWCEKKVGEMSLLSDALQKRNIRRHFVVCAHTYMASRPTPYLEP